MRKIINISLPADLEKAVNTAVASGKYATKSDFFRHMIRIWREEQALQEIRESQIEIARGKGRVLKSLKDLR